MAQPYAVECSLDVVVGDSPQTAKEIIDEAQRMDGDELKHKGLNEALAEVAIDGKNFSSNKLGYWLKKNARRFISGLSDRGRLSGQILGDLRFEKSKTTRTGIAAWALRQKAKKQTPGAFSLSENGLYTLEGWRAFFNALDDKGIFTVSRWYSPDNVDEAGRMISLATAF